MLLNQHATAATVVGGLVVGYAVWKAHKAGALPKGIVSINGRVDATQVDIATKIAGRVIEIVPHEGNLVEANSILARLDQAEIEAQLCEVQAEAQRACKWLAAAEASVASRKAELTFANQELERSAALIDRGYTPREKYDQRKQQRASAEGAVKAANAQVEEALAAIRTADAPVERLQTVLNDAPKHRSCKRPGVVPVWIADGSFEWGG